MLLGTWFELGGEEIRGEFFWVYFNWGGFKDSAEFVLMLGADPQSAFVSYYLFCRWSKEEVRK